MLKQNTPAIIIAATVILSVVLMTATFKNRHRSNDLVSVTGLGKKDFTSDLIVWSGEFGQKRLDLKMAYEAVGGDREIIKAYLVSKGVPEADFYFTAVDIDKQFRTWYDDNDNRQSEFSGYRLTQSVRVESHEVDKIEALSREVTELINQGVEFNSNSPSYYYTKLAELKIEMIAAATRDGRVRAEQIAKESKADLGNLRYARMGVFQIIGQNSNEDYSWGGSFNTSSKHKTATITMNLQFGVD